KKELDDWIAANVPDKTKQEQLKGVVDGFVDNAAKAGSGAAGGWVTGSINDVLKGPLEKYKDQISKWAAGAPQGAGGNVGGNFGNSYTVDRALDAGFGAGTDGPEGALLRSLRKLVYARMATVVTLHGEDGKLKSSFKEGELIKARVTYLFYCQIP